MVFNKNHFSKWICGNWDPLRDPPPPFMANAILNFHFDYWHYSLMRNLFIQTIWLIRPYGRTICVDMDGIQGIWPNNPPQFSLLCSTTSRHDQDTYKFFHSRSPAHLQEPEPFPSAWKHLSQIIGMLSKHLKVSWTPPWVTSRFLAQRRSVGPPRE